METLAKVAEGILHMAFISLKEHPSFPLQGLRDVITGRDLMDCTLALRDQLIHQCLPKPLGGLFLWEGEAAWEEQLFVWFVFWILLSRCHCGTDDDGVAHIFHCTVIKNGKRHGSTSLLLLCLYILLKNSYLYFSGVHNPIATSSSDNSLSLTYKWVSSKCLCISWVFFQSQNPHRNKIISSPCVLKQ